jgi:disulfide bond formation protein DsbB
MSPRLSLARWIALLVPLALIGGALGSQYLGGLVPCEMCMWQRYPHYAAIVVALLAFVVPAGVVRTLCILFAAVLVAVSGAIGVFHAGVEYHWWRGITACTAGFGHVTSSADMLAKIMNTPVIRCDAAQWTLFGISLAGFNAIFSLAGAVAVFALAGGSKRGGRA